MLRELFTTTALHYTDDEALAAQLWKEIETHYAEPVRHYHTLTHLEHLLAELEKVKTSIKHWNCLLFSLFYHDVIYNPAKQDNEEESALLAAKRLAEMRVSEETVKQCSEQILATKKHTLSPNADTNLFTDADLAILGADPARYDLYCQQIRQEYKIYPDFLYNAGRKTVLLHFLEMEKIFKTDRFFARFERQARENIQRELQVYG